MIIIKGTENDLSFIANSLHCKEDIFESKGINIIKGVGYDTGRIYRTLQQGKWKRSTTYWGPFNRTRIASLTLSSACKNFSYISSAFLSCSLVTSILS